MRNNRAGRKRTPRQNNSEPHSYTCVYVTIYIRYLTIHGTRSALCHFLLSNACVRLFLWIAPSTFCVHCTCICRSTMKRNKQQNKIAGAEKHSWSHVSVNSSDNDGDNDDNEIKKKKIEKKSLTETSLSIIYHIHFYFIICRSNRFQTFLNRFLRSMHE